VTLRLTFLVVLVASVLAATPTVAQVAPPIRLPGSATAESTIASGLREALTVGAQNAVERTGRLDGFFRNEAIKILMPDRLRKVETGLRAIGYGPQVDEFILAMNRAAERAAASAKPLFWDAIRTITSTTPARFSPAATRPRRSTSATTPRTG